jgi:hypothetical protein
MSTDVAAFELDPEYFLAQPPPAPNGYALVLAKLDELLALVKDQRAESSLKHKP